AEADNHARPRQFKFGFKPGAASCNFASAGLGMQSALAARLPFEMLDDVGYEHVVAINSGLLECLIQKRPGRPDKGMPGLVFLVAGGFAEEEHSSVGRSFSRYGLGGPCIQLAAATRLKSQPQRFNRSVLGQVIGCRWRRYAAWQ